MASETNWKGQIKCEHIKVPQGDREVNREMIKREKEKKEKKKKKKKKKKNTGVKQHTHITFRQLHAIPLI